MDKQIKIFLADDHHVFRDGIRVLLENEMQATVVGEAEHGDMVLEKLSDLQVDVILLDIDMPGMNGMELIKILGKDYNQIPVLILSSHDDEGYIHHMMKNGASGYLLKSCKKNELISALKTVTEGGTYMNKEISKKLFQYDAQKKENDTTKEIPLSKREIEILKLVAQGLTNQEIGNQLFISHRTVDTHRRNMMTKLDLHNAVALTRYAAENGLL